jgi:hypothetical protein
MKYLNKSFSVKGLSERAWYRIYGVSDCCEAKVEEVVENNNTFWRCGACGKKCKAKKKNCAF